MSVKTEVVENKEEIIDDLSKADVQMDKLAALKAKMAAQQKENMPPKIVETKKRAWKLGVIGSGQAGCIDGQTNIYLSKYGILPIKDLFDYAIINADLYDIKMMGGGHVCINLDKFDIYTVSMDPETGDFKKAKVKAVWKTTAKIKQKITNKNGTSLISSKKHPSLIYRPEINKKAYFASGLGKNPLSEGDRLIDTRLSSIDLISEPNFIRGIMIDEEVAWLLGVYAGDGSNDKSGNNISFYLDDYNLIEKTKKALLKIPNTSISESQKQGCTKISVYGLQARLFFETAFEICNTNTYGGEGSKTYTIKVPRCISASSSSVRTAFIAGLLDADGTVSNRWCESIFFTVSKDLSDTLCCLISSIGGRSSLEIIKSRRKNEQIGYRVKLAGKINHGPMFETMINFVQHSMKKERLNKWMKNEQKSFITSVVPLEYKEIKRILEEKEKIKSINSIEEKTNIYIKEWVKERGYLSVNTFNDLIDSFGSTENLTYLKKISPKLSTIKSVELLDDYHIFYDLTVENYENYLAGNNGFIVTHNSHLAENFHNVGYDAIAFNTAPQDLDPIKLPADNKFLLKYGMGGAAKEIEIGKAAAEAYRENIYELVSEKLGTCDMLVLCLSLGGGSGAGSAETMVDVLSSFGKPVIVMAVLPMSNEDAQAKKNALETLSKLAKETQNKKIANLIVVDNAKIESIYSSVNQFDFFDVANKAIIEPLDAFNTFSAQPSKVKPLDPMELGKLLTDGGGLSVYGEMTVPNYEDETAIAEAIISNLNNGLLASGFDIKQAKYVGAIIAAPKAVWDKIPSASVNYAMSMVHDLCAAPSGVFRGIYTSDSTEDAVKVYSFFSGLGLPDSRVQQLKKDAQEFAAKAKVKDEERNLNLKIDTGVEETTSQADKIRQKIAMKKSAFGSLLNNSVEDLRKKGS